MESRDKIKLAVDRIRSILYDFSDDERRDVFELIMPHATSYNARNFTREEIENALAQHGDSIHAAAAALDCSRKTLQNKMRRLGFPPGKSGRKPQRKMQAG